MSGEWMQNNKYVCHSHFPPFFLTYPREKKKPFQEVWHKRTCNSYPVHMEQDCSNMLSQVSVSQEKTQIKRVLSNWQQKQKQQVINSTNKIMCKTHHYEPKAWYFPLLFSFFCHRRREISQTRNSAERRIFSNGKKSASLPLLHRILWVPLLDLFHMFSN